MAAHCSDGVLYLVRANHSLMRVQQRAGVNPITALCPGQHSICATDPVPYLSNGFTTSDPPKAIQQGMVVENPTVHVPSDLMYLLTCPHDSPSVLAVYAP